MVRPPANPLERWLISKRKKGVQELTIDRYRAVVQPCLDQMRRSRRPHLPSRWRESDFDLLRARVARSRWAFTILVDFARFAGSRITPLVSFPPHRSSGRVRWLDRTAMESLIRSARTDPRWALIVVLGIGQGLRRIEWRRLRVDDIDLAARRMLVRGKGRATPKLVWMPIHPALPPIWKRFLASRDRLIARTAARGAVQTVPPEAFVHWWSGRLVPYSLAGFDALVARMGRRLASSSGSSRLASHMLRRSGATLLEEVLLNAPRPSLDGVYRTTQSFLRHDNVATTMRYLQANPARQRRALEQFGSALAWV